MNNALLATTLPNGRVAAIDPQTAFAGKVNGTITSALLAEDGRWDVSYTSPKGRALRKLVAL